MSSHPSCCSRRSIALLIATMALLLAAASSAAAATLSGTVTGQLPKGEAKALPEVKVTAFEAGSEKALASSATDGNGKYALEIPPGVYDVNFNPGSGSYEATTVHKVEVKDAQTLSVLLASAELLHLAGTLRDASGKAIPGASLTLNSKVTPLVNGETAADGSYSFDVSPGTYELQVYPAGPLSGLPKKWALQTDSFELTADESRDIELPAPSTLTVEALGKEGAPVSGATVRVPEMVGAADLGGYTTSHLRSPGIEGKTGEDGRAEILVFDGVSCGCSSPSVSPPAGSGYGDTSFEIAAVEGDTTVVVHFGAAQEEEPEGGEDVEAPQIHGLSIEPPEINTTSSAQTVTLFAHVTDDLSGFKAGSIFFKSPSGKQTAAGLEFKRVTGDAENGGYEIPVTFKQSSESGAWFISVIHLIDAAGNKRVVEPKEMEERGLSRQVIVESAEGGEDVQAPLLNELSIEPPEINTTSSAQTVTLFAHVTDDLSGFKAGSIFFKSPSGEQTAAGFEFKRVAGDANGGTYEIPVTFKQSSETGTWQISVIHLTDAAGNERSLGPKQIEELALPHTVLVKGEEEPEDTEPPQLKDLSLEPESIDTSTAKQPVLVTAIVTDNLSGFKEGEVVFISPNEKQIAAGGEFKLVAGGETEGVYEVVVTFPQGSEPGDWEIAKVRLRDRAGNEASIPGAEIENAELPHTVTVQGAQPPTVTGLNPSSGAAGGNTEVEISGTGFNGATEVEFGSAQAEFEVSSATSIHAISPAGTGTVDVTVTTPAGTSETSTASRFAYGPQVILSSSPNESVYGQKATFTAEIVAGGEGGPVPLGTVAFIDGSAAIAVVNLNGKGTATFSTTQLGAGKHQITAAYSGDANYPAAKSAALTQVVDKASTEVTLTSTLNPAPYGATGTLKASVFALAPGAGTPAGTVTFREGEVVLDIVQLSGHNATLSLKTLPLGAHKIVASYSGDFNDDPSESESLTQAIDRAKTETTLTSTLNPAPYGSSGTLKATVKAAAPAGGTPAGTVTFREGESVLAIVSLSSGTAKYPLGDLLPGKYEITATYDGGENYEGSAATLSQAIAKAETELTLTSSKNPAPEGASGTIKATVKPISPGGGTPTGTATFHEGETVLATIPLSNKTATYPLKALAAGTHEITVSYGGNANYEASEGSIAQVIAP